MHAPRGALQQRQAVVVLRPARLAHYQQIQGVGTELFLQKSFDSFKQVVALRTMTFPGSQPQGLQRRAAELRQGAPAP